MSDLPAAAQSATSELVTALAFPGMTLELFHHYGAPTAGDLQTYLDGTAQPSRDHQMQISHALANVKRTYSEGR
jgi:hypothetical protein